MTIAVGWSVGRLSVAWIVHTEVVEQVRSSQFDSVYPSQHGQIYVCMYGFLKRKGCSHWILLEPALTSVTEIRTGESLTRRICNKLLVLHARALHSPLDNVSHWGVSIILLGVESSIIYIKSNQLFDLQSFT